MQAILRIIRRFEWTWVGLLFSDEENGRQAARLLQSDLERSALGCVSYSEALPFDNDLPKLQRIVTAMRTSTARVVVAFGYGGYLYNVFEEVCGIENSEESKMRMYRSKRVRVLLRCACAGGTVPRCPGIQGIQQFKAFYCKTYTI